MNTNKSLIIDNRENVKGLHTYCSKCKRLTTTRVCGKTKKRISSCKFPEYHRFKIIKAIPGTDSKKKRTKILDTRDLNEAIKEKIRFEKELENNQYQKNLVILKNENSKPDLLIECMAMYIGYLNNAGVPLHKRRDRSKAHIDDFERVFKYFCKSLKINKIDHTILKVYSINDSMVAMYHNFLLNELELANATYNKYIAYLRQFITWLIEKKGYELENVFDDVTRRRQTNNNEIIEEDEFVALLKMVKPENGAKKFPSGERKNMYRYWIKDAFKIALETGLRREEFMTIRFSDIIDEVKFIRIENYKVNRSNNTDNEESKQYKFIPVTKPLREILYKLGYEQFKDTDKYVVATNEKSTRKTLMDKVSKAFTHFWKKTEIDKKLQLKNLRKTYLTALANHFGDSANLISDHADMEILKKHYLNNKKIVEKASDFSVFNTPKS